MCEAIQGLINDGIAEGIVKGEATKSRATQFKGIATAQSSSADVKRRRSKSFPPCWDAKLLTPATPANRAAEKPRTV